MTVEYDRIPARIPAPSQIIEAGSKDAVYSYIQLRLRSDEMQRQLKELTEEAQKALEEMQEAWRACKNAPPGVYSFKDFGRTVVVVDPNHDYPDLKQVVG